MKLAQNLMLFAARFGLFFAQRNRKIPGRVEEEGISIPPFGYGEDGWTNCRWICSKPPYPDASAISEGSSDAGAIPKSSHLALLPLTSADLANEKHYLVSARAAELVRQRGLYSNGTGSVSGLLPPEEVSAID